ncbi:unnamed protein product [Microthlaspi erraticum]|uniref:Uncharacterized protein n=1 Tax=Microthlaspi erraticum TaxID=1685480 RepID=A0A6D2J948_9BRAS|nr:unnamed protein product [Microthlaspi erraticum]
MHPVSVFSNWDKVDHYTKNIIIYSARKKCHMLMAYTEGVDLVSFISSNIPVGTSKFDVRASRLPSSFKRCLCLTKDDQEESAR